MVSSGWSHLSTSAPEQHHTLRYSYIGGDGKKAAAHHDSGSNKTIFGSDWKKEKKQDLKNAEARKAQDDKHQDAKKKSKKIV